MNTPLIAGVLVWTLFSAAAALSIVKGAPPESDAALELQTGPLVVEMFAPEAPLRLRADRGCLAHGCPLAEVRYGLAPAQGAQAETGRVQRLAPGRAERAGFSQEIARERLGQQGRMREAARAETGQNGEPGPDIL